MNKKYDRIYDELEFTRELLGLGLSSIRKANFQNKGIYLQAFSNLSLGLERFMKICLILDFYSHNNRFPENSSVRCFGHDLRRLFQKINSIFPYYNILDDIHLRIISHLSDFASGSGTRYSNINFITHNEDRDPIKDWYISIDMFIHNEKLSNKQKSDLLRRSESRREYGKVLSGLCLFVSEVGENIDSLGKLYELGTISEYISGFRVLYIIQIIEYLYNFLDEINNRNVNTEFFLWDLSRVFSTMLYGSDSEKRKRRNFTRTY